MENEQNSRILHDICLKNTFFLEFLEAIPSYKAESEQTRPQHQLRDHGGHRSMDAVVLNKRFMCLLTLFYCISLDI